MRTSLIMFSLLFCTFSYAQDRACAFKMFDGHPEIVFSDYTEEVMRWDPYVREEQWDKDKFDNLDVYRVFCEEMFVEAKKEIYAAFEIEPILSSMVATGHSEGYEIWDVVVKSTGKTYYIHFQFELSKE